MSKRVADAEGDAPLKRGDRPMELDTDKDTAMGEFEDEFEDEFEEDEIIEAGVDGRPDAEREADEKAAMDVDHQPGTFIVGRTKLEPGQVLAPDPSAYDMLHSLSTPWPCLSFDFVRDQLGDNRHVYPATMYAVAGTQAQQAKSGENQLLLLKFSGLGRMARDADGGDSDSDDEEDKDQPDEDSDPILESKSIPLTSTTNRVRVHVTGAQQTLTATMTESTNVLVHDISPHLAAFDTPGTLVTPQQNKPICTIRAHKAEGYGLDWSPLHAAGRLLTGDNDGFIYLTTRTDGGGLVTDNGRPFVGHAGSIEEIQWSPSEASVFASASSDGSVRVWDIRSKSRRPALSVQVSTSGADVNVMSWSRQTTHLLATGADDGVWGVWDLRQWKPEAAGSASSASATSQPQQSTPIASFGFHKEPVTSIEWHPTDDSIVAVASADNTVTLWDLAVELDDEESRDTAGVQDVPPQLLFVHYHANVKEVHWHPQIAGTLMATGDEFGIFKTISV